MSKSDEMIMLFEECKEKKRKKMKKEDFKTAIDMQWWNQANEKDQFTKEEHSKAEGCTAWKMMLWNVFCREQESYTKEEHSKAEGCSVYDMWRWNDDCPDQEPYTYEEIFEQERKENE